MADELDYIYPGTVFICLGVLACVNNFYLALTGKHLESGMCQSVTITIKGVIFPFESFSRMLLCIIGILIEILTTSSSDVFLRSRDSQEMLMYCFYMFAAFCECACILASSRVDRKISTLSYAVASFAECYLAFHFVEARENSCITMCWSLLAAVQGSMFLLLALGLNNVTVLIVKNAALILHGTWLYHIAFSNYIYSNLNNRTDRAPLLTSTSPQLDDNRDLEMDSVTTDPVTVRVSKVAFDFALHLLLAFMLTIWIFIAMSIVLYTEETTRGSIGMRPLVDDDEISDFDEPSITKDDLESRIVPESVNDNTNANESVTNFGI